MFCSVILIPYNSKLPYIRSFSKNTKKKINELCKKFCKNSSINIVFSLFKTGDLFLSKDCLPSGLKSFIVYKFVCAGCQSYYIGKTKRHLPTRINEHLVNDKKSHIFKRLLEKPACKNLCHENCFTIMDSTSSSFRLKLKEALHITWLKSNLTILAGKNCFTQFSTRMAAWLLLTFFICLHNQLSSIDSIITY